MENRPNSRFGVTGLQPSPRTDRHKNILHWWVRRWYHQARMVKFTTIVPFGFSCVWVKYQYHPHVFFLVSFRFFLRARILLASRSKLHNLAELVYLKISEAGCPWVTAEFINFYICMATVFLFFSYYLDLWSADFKTCPLAAPHITVTGLCR